MTGIDPDTILLAVAIWVPVTIGTVAAVWWAVLRWL